MIFTIIVPVYNGEKYLRRCVSSVFHKNKTHQDFEMIVVDDGSTDKTPDILDEMEKELGQLHIIHTANHGVSHGRNTAINMAKGKYILFLDSDDYLLSDWHDTVSKCIADDRDWYIFDFIKKYTNGHERKLTYSAEGDHLRWCETKFLTSNQMNPCWSRLYKKSIIDEYNIRFDETMSVGEDVDFALKYFEHTRSVRIVHTPILYKEQRKDGVMHSISGQKYLDQDAKLLTLRKQYMDKANRMDLYQQCLRLHFSAVTNVLLRARDTELVRELLRCSYIKDLAAELDGKGLSLMKKSELLLIRLGKTFPVSSYFKMKAIFLRFKKDFVE